MDIQKTIIYIGLFFVSLMLWAEWQKDQTKDLQPSVQSTSIRKGAIDFGTQKTIEIEKEADIETIKRAPTHLNQEPTQTSQEIKRDTKLSENVISVITDVLDIKIDRLGGTIIKANLLEHFVSSDRLQNYPLFNTKNNELYLAEMGLVVNGKVLPKTLFMSNKSSYELTSGGNTVKVKLTGIQNNGISVERIYTFTKGKYSIGIETNITNNGESNWLGKLYYQLVRKEPPAKSSGFLIGMNSYLGASISDQNNKLYEKVSFSDISKNPLTRTVTDGWVAMQEHYYLTSFIPDVGSTNVFYSQEFDGLQYAIGYSTASKTIKKGEKKTYRTTLYAGPEVSDQLKELSPGLELTIDYGWLWFISTFLFSILKAINSYVGNWGWSIIFLTILIKLVFYKLSAASYRSMANLKKFQPKMAALKEKHGDDKTKLNKAMMEMYKKEKINPLGGCLPILVQIPVFIALYWVLLESVEIRHAPFILWIHDLSTKDPFYVLPILMGATMFLQQRMSPPPADPVQAKVMSFLPIMFTFLFISVPAGLVLYWTVNNLLSIAQQYYITKTFESKPKKKAKKSLSNA